MNRILFALGCLAISIAARADLADQFKQDSARDQQAAELAEAQAERAAADQAMREHEARMKVRYATELLKTGIPADQILTVQDLGCSSFSDTSILAGIDKSFTCTHYLELPTKICQVTIEDYHQSAFFGPPEANGDFKSDTYDCRNK